MKRLLTAIFIVSLIASCASGVKKDKVADTALMQKTKRLFAKTDSINRANSAPGWRYSEDEDKMTSKRKYYAKVSAKEKLQFDYPYSGGSTATITVRNKEGDNDVMLSVTKGQFNTSYDGMAIRVRFDSSAAVSYNCSGASSGEADIIFIKSESKFISKLKAASKVTIEAEFYSSGKHVMEFDVAGLEWKH